MSPEDVVRLYPDLGAVLDIRPLDVDVVSSRLQRIETDRGVYVWKQPLYHRTPGQALSEARLDWQLIGRLRDGLRMKGVPVESPCSTTEGDWLVEAGDSLCWLTPYYAADAFGGDLQQVSAAGRGLGQFHRAGLELMTGTPELEKQARVRLKRDRLLPETLETFDELVKELLLPGFDGRHSVPPELSESMAFVREVASADLLMWCDAIRTRPEFGADARNGLCHHDYHPANVLFPPGGGLVILDLEQMGIGPVMKCLAMAATRFALAAVESRDPDALREMAGRFLHSYRETGPLTREELRLLPDWIRYLELEKTLRILGRFLEGERYPAMIRKLQTHHLWLCRNAEIFVGLL